MRKTKRIFDDSHLNGKKHESPILQEEIEEIASFRKTKHEAFTTNLYEDFPRVSKKSGRKHIGEQTKTNGVKSKDDFYKALNERKSYGIISII